MNLIIENKKVYIIACFIVAMIYALLTGIQPIANRMADGVIYGVILFPIGIMLWNIFQYALPKSSRSFYPFIMLAILAVLTTVLIVGIETFAMYLCFPSRFGDFIATIPVRLFITLLLFIISRLFYTAYYREEQTENKSNNPQPTTFEWIERITVRNGQKIKIIPVDEIIYLQADGDYIAIYTTEGRWLKEQTMKYTEEILPPDQFIRTHRSFIVNVKHISRIERYGEQQLIILSNGEKTKISNARYQLLKQRLGI